MAGRFSKNSGAVGLLDRSPQGGDLLRFRPDFYVPADKPSRQGKFRQVRPTPGFGRGLAGRSAGAARRAGRLAGPGLFGGALLVAGYLAFGPGNGRKRRLNPGNFELRERCYEPVNPFHVGWGWDLSDAGHLICIAGQSASGLWDLNDAPDWTTSWTLWDVYQQPGSGITRGHMMEHWVRIAPNACTPPACPNEGTLLDRRPAVDGMPNPNDERNAPSPAPAPYPHGEGAPPPGRGRGTPSAPRPRPPGARTRERKSKTNLQRVLRFFDAVSETAELFGAFYDALPQDVKSKWKCNELSRGLLDSAGQYGISGADCKARALWHNWHHVDIEQALKNVVANEIQDRVIGAIAANSPRNVGHATDAGNELVNDVLQWIFGEAGLT